MEELKKYEDKMNKTLDVLEDEFGASAQDGPTPMCWTRSKWITTAPPRPFSR